MAHAGGSTKCGGGAKCGGGPSIYEAWIETIWDLWGRGVFERSRGDSSKNITKLISVIAGQYEGAEVDALRIQSEGIAGSAVESQDDWVRIYQIDRSDLNEDALRLLLEALQSNQCNYTSAARVETVANGMIASIGDGRYGLTSVHEGNMTYCAVADNAGDGIRYVAVLVPEWVWKDYRPWFRALQEWCDRSDAFYGETTVCVSTTTWMGVGNEPAFYCNKSLVDRDAVRN